MRPRVTATPLVLVIVAAVLHATWNLVLKQSGGSGLRFFLLVSIVECLLLLPLALGQCAFDGYAPPAEAYLRMVVSGVVHIAYFLFLGYGYRSGQLSVVYPLARATGPLLSIVGAVVILGEQPAPVALGGALAVGLGAIMLTGNPFALGNRGGLRGIGFSLATGAMIAVYTIWDQMAVKGLLVKPTIYYGGSILVRLLLLMPFALRDSAAVVDEWRKRRIAVIFVGVLSPLSYLLVLFAMQLAQLSYVAPLREISILFAALLGTQLLREGEAARRLTAAVVMIAGFLAIALGGK